MVTGGEVGGEDGWNRGWGLKAALIMMKKKLNAKVYPILIGLSLGVKKI